MNALPTPDLAAVPGPAAPDALALLAEVLDAPDLAVAARALAARLVQALAASRAAVALWRQGELQLLALSGMDEPDAQSDLVRLLLGAMNEAMEQGATLTEPPSAHDAGLIRLELAALRQRVGGTLLVLPLADTRRPGQALGAVLLERHDGAAFGPEQVDWLAHALALAAPALALRAQADEGPLRRLARGVAHAWQRLQDPQQRTRRRLWQAGAALLALGLLLPLPHRVGGNARLEGAEQRVLAAPTDGFIKAAPTRPGDRVAAGAVLLELAERDLQLERERWASTLAQHENAYAAAMARGDRTQAAVSAAKVDEAQAQLGLLDEQLARSRLLAPMDGVVIQGDWSQQIGAPVRQGDALVTLASTDGQRVVIEVDEFDIADVHAGQGGALLLSALPWGAHDIVVERVSPLAKVVDGRNVFEVQARLLQADPTLRPGLQGRARVRVGWLPPLLAWARPWLLRARVALWAW